MSTLPERRPPRPDRRRVSPPLRFDDYRGRRLVIMPSMRIGQTPGGKFILTRKFIDGVNLYSSYWEGPICVFGERRDRVDDNLDQVEVSADELQFDVKIVEFDRRKLPIVLKDDDVLLLSLEPQQCFIPELRELKKLVKVYISEYSLETRKQIVLCRTQNPLKIIKQSLRETYHESLFRHAVALADGVQCNGKPTYNNYHTLSRNALLFFDTRVKEDMLATQQTILERGIGDPIRLTFSGRLIQMKGADHLVDVAKHLSQLGVKFEMTICGGGVLEKAINREIKSCKLTNYVKMKGVLDFESELVPFVKNQTDLFVCCHRQGDPSCTYLETMSCGVPIVGYDNEAFRGIVLESKCGWFTPINRPDVLAGQIAHLARNHEEIRHHAVASLEFACRHTFEKTFERRVDHLKEIALAPKSSELLSSTRMH